MKSETKSTPIGISDTSGTPWKALGLLTCAVMFAMSLWFSASAVVPTLMRLWHLSGPATIWLTTSVQIGFITGALISATLGLPDLLNARKLLVSSCFLAATFNALFLVVGSNIAAGLLLRFLTGVTLAGVYPIAVKIVSTWFTRKRGLAVGILIAGLTIGSALPYLIRGTGAFDYWQTVIVGSSLLAQIGGFIVWFFISDVPQPLYSRFQWGALGEIIRDRPVMLANLGYFGHMWELYAMWTWLPLFLLTSWHLYVGGVQLVIMSAIAAFASIGLAGATGALFGGWMADRYGRTLTIIVALAVSGGCALLIGLTFQGPTWLTLLVALLWGIAVIADSAQFSTAVTELSPPRIVGSAVTFQLAIGFLITVLSINLIPLVQTMMSWRWAFAILSLGPAVGILAMVRLRQNSSACRLAHGQR